MCVENMPGTWLLMLVYDNKLSFGKADVFFLLHRT